ncbi:hypothetical protein KUCAC02_026733 [Chaenocephalus aceratus]|nr:hypothetical protein KUCAC02_026733 [Chaenocephalus aceratus]
MSPAELSAEAVHQDPAALSPDDLRPGQRPDPDARYHAVTHTGPPALNTAATTTTLQGVSPDVFQSPVVLTEGHAEPQTQHHHFASLLWFLRPTGETSLQPTGFHRYPKVVEKPFQGFLNMSGDGETEAFLHVLRPRRPSHGGHYFCAASSRISTQSPRQKP